MHKKLHTCMLHHRTLFLPSFLPLNDIYTGREVGSLFATCCGSSGFDDSLEGKGCLLLFSLYTIVIGIHLRVVASRNLPTGTLQGLQSEYDEPLRLRHVLR